MTAAFLFLPPFSASLGSKFGRHLVPAITSINPCIYSIPSSAAILTITKLPRTRIWHVVDTKLVMLPRLLTPGFGIRVPISGRPPLLQTCYYHNACSFYITLQALRFIIKTLANRSDKSTLRRSTLEIHQPHPKT